MFGFASSDCTACLCKSQQKQSQGNSTVFHSVVLVPDNHQEAAQSNGDENGTIGSSQEQANSEIQKELLYQGSILGLKAAHIFVASSRELFSILSYCHYQIHTCSLQTDGFPLKFAEDLTKTVTGRFAPFFTLSGHSGILHFASIVRWYLCKGNLQVY